MFEKEAEEYANGKGHERYNYLFESAGSPADFARMCFKDLLGLCITSIN